MQTTKKSFEIYMKNVTWRCCYSTKWKSAKKLDHHLIAFKVWKCNMDIAQTKKGKSPLFEQFIAWNSAIDLQNITHFTYCRRISTKCLFFPFWKHLSTTLFHGFTTSLQVYFTLNDSPSNEIICCLWPHLIWAGAWAGWPSEHVPASVSCDEMPLNRL